jgi:uncharacterized protein
MICNSLLRFVIVAVSISALAYGMAPDPNGELLTAAEENNIAAVKYLLKIDAIDVNCVDQTNIYDHTPLTYACAGGYLEIAELLLENKADVNAGKKSPLFWASFYGHLSLVKLLLKNGCEIKQNKYEDDPLLVCCFQEHIDIVKLLLAYGACVNIQHYENGITPLMAASIARNLEIVQLLLANNADTEMKNKSGHTASSFALEDGYTEIVKAIDDEVKKREYHVIWHKRLVDYFKIQLLPEFLALHKRT